MAARMGKRQERLSRENVVKGQLAVKFIRMNGIENENKKNHIKRAKKEAPLTGREKPADEEYVIGRIVGYYFLLSLRPWDITVAHRQGSS